MLKLLLAILMLFSLGVSSIEKCEHDSVSHSDAQTLTEKGNTSSSNSSEHDTAPTEHCCQFHCHQLVSIVPETLKFNSYNFNQQIVSTYKVLYTGPALALNTRPPLAA